MGDVGTEHKRRYPRETSGADALRRAARDCPPDTHEVLHVYPVRPTGYEAVIRRRVHPRARAEYHAALRVWMARGKRGAPPEETHYDHEPEPRPDDDA